jgi:hypothetical protein
LSVPLDLKEEYDEKTLLYNKRYSAAGGDAAGSM